MALPNSPTLILNPGDPIPASLINDIQYGIQDLHDGAQDYRTIYMPPIGESSGGTLVAGNFRCTSAPGLVVHAVPVEEDDRIASWGFSYYIPVGGTVTGTLYENVDGVQTQISQIVGSTVGAWTRVTDVVAHTVTGQIYIQFDLDTVNNEVACGRVRYDVA